MEKNLIDFNIDNIDGNLLTKKLFLKKNNIDFTYVIEFKVKDLKNITDNNILFQKPYIYFVSFILESIKDINYKKGWVSYKYVDFADSNEDLINTFYKYKKNRKNVSKEHLESEINIYLERLEINPLVNIEDIYFFQVFVYMKIINNNLLVYLYNHYYYITINFNSNFYNVNYINGYSGLFSKNSLEYMKNQVINIVSKVMDLYAKYVENDNESIDIWRFVFSIDNKYKLKLYNYKRYNNDFYIYNYIKEKKNNYTNNDLLTNINNFNTPQNNNFILLKKYNLL